MDVRLLTSTPRHNQDLIKELARTKSELELARIEAENGRPLPSSRNASAAHLPGPDHPDVPGHDRSPLPGPESAYLPQDPKPRIREQHASPDQPPTKKRRLANDQDLSKISMNMQRYGRGIFQATHSHRLTHPPVSISSDVPALPGKETADVLLRHYHSIIHPIIPVLYWHEFHKQYDRVYEEGSLQNVPRIWVGLLFAIFAIGTLQLDWKEGQKYLEISKSQIDIFTEDPTLDHARVALFASIFLVETNSKSAGWTWLGVATRIALDLGLHCEIGAGSAIEQEMRRRIWWCIYSCDWSVAFSYSDFSNADYPSLLCLEMGRPSMVREEDCNVRMPSPMDDQHILPGSDWTAPTPAQSTSLLPSMLQAIGGITRLLRILRVPRLTSHTLQAYESHFTKCIDDFLVQRQVHLHDYVDPLDLPPIMYLQNARLMLHRNNLNPQCPASARSQAIDSCASMAKSTANLLRRCMQVPPTESHSPGTMTAPQSSTTWETRLLSTASAFLCTHIWRCTLFLCFRLDFHDALSCARASAVLGNARPVNVACGKYLEFYLRELTARLDQGHSSGFDTDEEMMAYVSGDLQGCYGSSWVWQGQDSAVVGGGGGNVPSEDHHGLKGSLQNTNGITTNEDAEEEDSKWDAWHTVLQTMERLALTQAQTQAQAPPEAQLKAKEQDPSPPPQSTSSSSSTPPAPQSQRPPPPRTRRISPPGSDPDQLRSMARSPEAQAAVRERMRIRDLI